MREESYKLTEGIYRNETPSSELIALKESFWAVSDTDRELIEFHYDEIKKILNKDK